MTPHFPDSPPRWYARRYLWLFAALLFGLAYSAQAVRSEAELNAGRWSEFAVYALAAQRMQANQSVNVIASDGPQASKEELQALLGIEVNEALAHKLHSHTYAYPPFFAFVTVAFVAPGKFLAASILWHLVMFGALILALRIAWLLTFSRPHNEAVSPAPSVLDRPLPLVLVTIIALVVVAGDLLAPITNQQNDSLLFACVMLGGWCLLANRQIAAGLAFGVAAAAKGPLLLVMPWLMWKRRWVAASVTLVSAVGLNLVPDLFFSPSSHTLFVVEWYERVLAPATRSGTAADVQGVWARFNPQNFSLSAALSRLLSDGRGEQVPQGLAALDPRLLRWASMTLLLGLMAGAFLVLARFTRPVRSLWPDGRWCRTSQESDRPGLARELSVVLVLALLASPMTSPAHLCVLALPAFVLAHDIVTTRDRWLVLFSSVCVLPMLVARKDLIGSQAVELLRFYGMGTAVLLFMLFALMRSCRLTYQQA